MWFIDMEIIVSKDWGRLVAVLRLQTAKAAWFRSVSAPSVVTAAWPLAFISDN